MLLLYEDIENNVLLSKGTIKFKIERERYVPKYMCIILNIFYNIKRKCKRPLRQDSHAASHWSSSFKPTIQNLREKYRGKYLNTDTGLINIKWVRIRDVLLENTNYCHRYSPRIQYSFLPRFRHHNIHLNNTNRYLYAAFVHKILHTMFKDKNQQNKALYSRLEGQLLPRLASDEEFN